MIPKVKFRKMTLQENISLIKWAYYNNNESLDVHKYTIEHFPELAKIQNDLSKEDVYNKIEEVVTNDYNKYHEKIKNEIKRYNNIWKKYNDIYFNMLSDYFNIDWPNIDSIECTIGLIPVFPRYLDSFSFSLGINIENNQVIETIAHETLHFMWFHKWKQIHPKTSRREYDSPYITWQYSEMVTDPILNNKPFSNIFGNIFIERGYDSFYELYDGNNLIMDKLRKLYSENISTEDKMNNGFVYIKNYLENKSKTI